MEEMNKRFRPLKVARRKVGYKAEVKLLGVVLEMGLTFRNHSEELKKRVPAVGEDSGHGMGSGLGDLALYLYIVCTECSRVRVGDLVSVPLQPGSGQH
jgi:hypothetical protein